MKKVTLQVNGRWMTFSEQELRIILENHFSNEVTSEVKCFEVNPLGIDQKLFRDKREDSKQEKTRQLILEAFTELNRNPERYGKKFKSMVPNPTWPYKTISDLKRLACNLGDHIADWVEQSLEWAQRISDGETWEAICNNKDTANWYRLVIWKDGQVRIVGGCRNCNKNYPASDVDRYPYHDEYGPIAGAVPLVVLYEN